MRMAITVSGAENRALQIQKEAYNIIIGLCHLNMARKEAAMIEIVEDCEDAIEILKVSKKISRMRQCIVLIDGVSRAGEPWQMQERQLVINPEGMSDQAIADRFCRTVTAVRKMRTKIKRTRQIWAR